MLHGTVRVLVAVGSEPVKEPLQLTVGVRESDGPVAEGETLGGDSEGLGLRLRVIVGVDVGEGSGLKVSVGERVEQL